MKEIKVTNMMQSITKFCNDKSNSIGLELRTKYATNKSIRDALAALERLKKQLGSIIIQETL